MSEYMERLKEIGARKEQLRAETADAKEERLAEITKEARELADEEKEIRAKMELENDLKTDTIPAPTSRGVQNERELRAADFMKSGKTEIRSVLAGGTIAKPASAANTVNGLAAVASDIVDDVHAFSLNGTGSWKVAYKNTNAAAADVTEGNAVAGTGSTYDYVEVSPTEWGVLDEVSQLVKKMSPVDYLGAVEDSALGALRDEASEKIIAAVKASSLARSVIIPLDADYLKTVVLGFRAIKGKGITCLYLPQADLLTLSKVRGANEKKALYEIKFDEDSVTSGVISEGGLATRFRVLDGLTEGEQLFGQPGTIDMPMWGGYDIQTDEHGDYFKRRMIGVVGTQVAGVDLVAKDGMTVIANQE